MPIFDASEINEKETTNNRYIDRGLVGVACFITVVIALVRTGHLARAVGWSLLPILLLLAAYAAVGLFTRDSLVKRVWFGILALLIIFWFIP